MKTVTFFRCLQAGLLSVALLSGATYSHAASGTWIHAASGGLWSATGNWSGGTIADGSGSTADFSSIDITANNTVHMDAPHTLTSLIFDDTDPSTTAGWIVDSNSVAGNILTLAGSSPTITVNSMGSGATVTMGVIITNSNTGANSYWTKAGNGTLVLNSANTFTNGVKISAGTLKLGTTTARPGTGQMILSGGMFDLGSASGTVGIGSTYAALSITAAAPSGNTIQGGTLQAFSYAASLSSGNAIVTTALVGTGPAITKSGAGTLTLAGNNSFTGVANIQNGILSVATINRNASTSAPPQSATSNLGKPIDAAHGQINLGNSGNTGQLTDTGTGETSDRTLNLAGTSGGGIIDQSGTGLLKFTGPFTATTAGAKTLTLQGSTAGTGEIDGVIVDSSSGTTALVKSGTGTWTLAGANTFSGNTTINGGTLALGSTGAISNSPSISIAAGATLDVSAIATFNLSSSTTLTASGSASAATIKGGAGGTVNLGGQAITLNYDGSNPALTISQGTLSLSGQTITVNSALLANGTYNIIHQASGSITHSGSYTLVGTMAGLGYIGITSGNVQMIITNGSLTASTTTLSANETHPAGTENTIAATVTAGATGTVQFSTNGVAFDFPVSLTGTSAAMPSTAALPPGTYTVTAAYSGDGTYAASSTTSSSTLTVTAIPVALGATRNYDGTPALAGSILSITNIVAADIGNVSLTGTGQLDSRNAGTRTISVAAVPTLVQSANGASANNSVTSFTVTLPHDPIAGDTLIIVTGVGTTSGNWVTGVSGGGVGTWSSAIDSAGSSSPDSSIWYAPNVPGGTGNRTITITLSGSGKSDEAFVMEYSGLAASPLDKVATSRATGTALASGTLATTTQASELVVAGLGVAVNTTTVSGVTAGYALAGTAVNPTAVYVYTNVISAVGTPSVTGTGSVSAQWSGVIASFKAASLALTGSAAVNYTFSGMSSSVTVNQEALSVTAVAATKNYDGTTNSAVKPTIDTGTIMGGDTANFVETYDTRNVGTGKTLALTGNVTDGNSGNNYTYTLNTGATGVINQTNLTVTAAAATKPYDGTTNCAVTPTFTVGSIQTGDTGSFIETYDTPAIGTGKTLTPSGSVTDGNGGANYNLAFVAAATGTIASLVNTNTFTFTNIVSGNNLNLSWPTDRKGWRLQVQTNALVAGLSTNWFDWPNSTNLTSVSVPLDPSNPSVFLRMVYP